MTPSVFLRSASVITLLFAAGHAMGAVDSWSPSGETAVLGAMRSFHFDVMGTTRTYLDFYLGFGLYITVLLLLQAPSSGSSPRSQGKTPPSRVR